MSKDPVPGTANERNFPIGLPDRILLSDQEGVWFVDPQEIIFCQADSNYTTFHLRGGGKRTVCSPLKEHAQRLGAYPFFRVHQSYLVNLYCVRAVLRSEGGKLLLDGGCVAYLARSRREHFFSCFGGRC